MRQFSLSLIHIYLDKVPTGQNYAIGCTANTIRKYRNTSVYTTGYIEGQKKKGLQPQSLYDAQLAAVSYTHLIYFGIESVKLSFEVEGQVGSFFNLAGIPFWYCKLYFQRRYFG